VGEDQFDGVGLAEAIATVRRELEQATEEGAQSALAFRTGPVELEFLLSFSKSGSADAGVRAWVVSAGAKGEWSQATTHRLKLSLNPVRRSDGADQIISDTADR
jgi:hypothetical protein